MRCLKLKSISRGVKTAALALAAASLLLTGTFAWQRTISRRNEFTGNGGGSLIVEKELKSADPADSDREFSFTLTLTGDNVPSGLSYTLDGDGERFAFTSGDIFRLKAGRRAIFSRLPAGTGYTVTELEEAAPDYEELEYAPEEFADAFEEFDPIPEESEDVFEKLAPIPEESGDAPDELPDYSENPESAELPEQPELEENAPSAEIRSYTALVREYKGFITGSEYLTLLFTNVFDERGETGALKLAKSVTGSGAGAGPASDAFEFAVTFHGGAPEHYTREDGLAEGFTNGGPVLLRDGESALFTDIAPGTKYSVNEKDYSADGYITSVTDAEGTIAGGETVSLLVENRRDAPAPPEASDPPVPPPTYTPPPAPTPPSEPPVQESPAPKPSVTPTPEATPTPSPTPAEPEVTPPPAPSAPSPPPPSTPGGAVVPNPDGEWTWDEDEGVWIFEPYPPLSNTPPKTSDGNLTGVWLTVYIASAILLRLSLFRRARGAQNI